MSSTRPSLLARVTSSTPSSAHAARPTTSHARSQGGRPAGSREPSVTGPPLGRHPTRPPMAGAGSDGPSSLPDSRPPRRHELQPGDRLANLLGEAQDIEAEQPAQVRHGAVIDESIGGDTHDPDRGLA